MVSWVPASEAYSYVLFVVSWVPQIGGRLSQQSPRACQPPQPRPAASVLPAPQPARRLDRGRYRRALPARVRPFKEAAEGGLRWAGRPRPCVADDGRGRLAPLKPASSSSEPSKTLGTSCFFWAGAACPGVATAIFGIARPGLLSPGRCMVCPLSCTAVRSPRLDCVLWPCSHVSCVALPCRAGRQGLRVTYIVRVSRSQRGRPAPLFGCKLLHCGQ